MGVALVALLPVLVPATASADPASGPVPQGAPWAQEILGDASSSVAWPVPGDVVAAFDPPEPDWLPGHRGIDLLAPPGTPVVAPRAGSVSFAGWVGGKPVVTVWHGWLRSTFEPVVATRPLGSVVTAGEVIGVVATPEEPVGIGAGTSDTSAGVMGERSAGPADGSVLLADVVSDLLVSTGSHCDGMCLHWGVRDGRRYVDPVLLLSVHARLVPLPEAQRPTSDVPDRSGHPAH